MEFKRPTEGFRAAFGGIDIRDVPDAIPQGKFSAAQNIRSTGSNSIRTRPGYVPLFYAGSNATTDIRGYSTLLTDSLPRFLARDSAGAVWLDSGALVGNLGGNAGYGASMIPFRPSESPQSWMYVGTEGDYQKFSAPTANNVVTQYKVGIAEPQVAVDAAPMTWNFTPFTGVAANWVAVGTANNATDGTQFTDTLGACFQDPVLPTRWYVQVGSNNAVYSIGQQLNVNGIANVLVNDVFPPLGGSGLTVQAVIYDANGIATVTLNQVSDSESPILSGLRRGSILSIAGTHVFISGSACLVLGVITGPNGELAFQTAAAGIVVGAAVSGLLAIAIDGGGASYFSGELVSPKYISSVLGNGTAQLIQEITNPFATKLPGNQNAYPQQDDYVHVRVYFSNPTVLVQLLIMFSLDAFNDYTQDMVYYAVRPSDLVQVPSGNQTLLPAILQAAENELIGELPTAGNIASPSQLAAGNNQWSDIQFPISAMTRIGSEQSKTLADCSGVSFLINVNNTVTFSFGGLWVGGGGQPDVGNNGAPYQYQCVPLASSTGVRGNPTPVMRYGVSPMRQQVLVKTSALNASYDSQIDTWEVNRYGGAVTSYRQIGTVPVGQDFVDDVFDDAATAGNPLAIDNTEPWPSIDVPWRQTTNVVAFGPFLTVTGSPLPATMSRWLPGTIFQVGGQQAYTLRSRPMVSGTTVTFEFEECIGSGPQSSVFVLEPNVARQLLPYLWGPDAYGTVFGSGDPLRPGVVQWAKQYAPDAVPSSQTQELSPPSEPQMGGEVIAGISLAASSLRWWALYFQAGGTPAYTAVEVPMGKRLASPFGKCSDGQALYFWATDCIAMTGGQGPAKSLTDDDLYTLFPHGGLSGKNVTRGPVTFYAPDYSRATTFRMAVREGILYALYQDSTGTPRMLVGQIKQNGAIAWSQDSYAAKMTTVYAIEQPKGTLELAPALYPAVVMGANNGAVVKLQDLSNDGANPISGFLYTPEWDGGDLRMNELWGDHYVDVLSPSGMTVTPVNQGNNVAPPTVIAASNGRQFVPVSLGGGRLLNFLGLTFSWVDNFISQNNASHLYAWQPSLAEQVETITDRAGDWTDCGTPDNKFFQGVKIDADTFNATKQLLIVDADTGATHALQPEPIVHNGRQTIAYSFATPFLAHSVKDVPQDMVPWRRFGIEYIWQPTPEAVYTWTTQWTALGGRGYKHIARIEASFNTTQAALLLVQSYDGQSPDVLNLPPSGGNTQKLLLTLTFNKGQLYRFSATSSGRFQIFLEDFIVWRGEWGRDGAYEPYRLLGGSFGDKAPI